MTGGTNSHAKNGDRNLIDAIAAFGRMRLSSQILTVIALFLGSGTVVNLPSLLSWRGVPGRLEAIEIRVAQLVQQDSLRATQLAWQRHQNEARDSVLREINMQLSYFVCADELPGDRQRRDFCAAVRAEARRILQQQSVPR